MLQLDPMFIEQSSLQNKGKPQNMIVFRFIFLFFFHLYRIGLGMYFNMSY